MDNVDPELLRNALDRHRQKIEPSLDPGDALLMDVSPGPSPDRSVYTQKSVVSKASDMTAELDLHPTSNPIIGDPQTLPDQFLWPEAVAFGPFTENWGTMPESFNIFGLQGRHPVSFFRNCHSQPVQPTPVRPLPRARSKI